MCKLPERAKSEKGFTLAELIVVIAILGALIGIAAPTVISYIADANARADEANIRIIQDTINRMRATDPNIDTEVELLASNFLTELGGSLPAIKGPSPGANAPIFVVNVDGDGDPSTEGGSVFGGLWDVSIVDGGGGTPRPDTAYSWDMAP